ncbi:MAG TPA: hypothetical protein VI583_14375 [Cyclobacteriaceae bacterium]|nr:hypothetical protein [Cyclobacteriaceae bacterium]
MKKTSNVIIISLALGFTVIGIHQAVMVGFGKSYWIFMLAISLYLWYFIRVKHNSE